MNFGSEFGTNRLSELNGNSEQWQLNGNSEQYRYLYVTSTMIVFIIPAAWVTKMSYSKELIWIINCYLQWSGLIFDEKQQFVHEKRMVFGWKPIDNLTTHISKVITKPHVVIIKHYFRLNNAWKRTQSMTNDRHFSWCDNFCDKIRSHFWRVSIWHCRIHIFSRERNKNRLIFSRLIAENVITSLNAS